MILEISRAEAQTLRDACHNALAHLQRDLDTLITLEEISRYTTPAAEAAKDRITKLMAEIRKVSTKIQDAVLVDIEKGNDW